MTARRVLTRRLLQELAEVRQMSDVTSSLVEAAGPDGMFDRLLEASMAVMDSDMGSIQMLYPDRGELRLLAHRGFSATAAGFWQWVRPASGSTCAAAMRERKRIIAEDIEVCDLIAGSEDLEVYRAAGIRAVQSTPLISRSGKLLGMISNHWRARHRPLSRQLRLLDGIACSAAGLMERARREELRHKTTLAHEINNPLQALANLLTLMKDHLSTDPAGAELAEMAAAEMRRVIAISHRMLDHGSGDGAARATLLSRKARNKKSSLA